jgi:hypothetical protein
MKKHYKVCMFGLLLAGTACSAKEDTAPDGNVAGTADGTQALQLPTTPPEQVSPNDEAWNAGWPQGGAQLSQSALTRAQALPGCILLAQNGADAPVYARRSFDAQLRLVEEQPIESDGTSKDPSDPNLSHALYWCWDGAGRLEMRAGGGSGYRAFRQDYQRDEQGNLTASSFVYSDDLELGDSPSGEPYSAVYYRNTYGSDGLLSGHSVERAEGANGGLSPSFTYQHDQQGRCQVVSSTSARGVQINRLEYDESDRMKLRTTEVSGGAPTGTVSDPIKIVESLQYDEQGRVIRIESDGEADFKISTADGVPDTFWRTRYYADGSKLTESLGFTGDVRSDQVERNGVLESAWHYFEFWSAGCQAVQANVPAPTSLACSSDY